MSKFMYRILFVLLFCGVALGWLIFQIRCYSYIERLTSLPATEQTMWHWVAFAIIGGIFWVLLKAGNWVISPLNK